MAARENFPGSFLFININVNDGFSAAKMIYGG